MNFKTWLDTFVDEKGIDLEDSFEVEGNSGTNFMTYENVVEAILSAPLHERNAIRDMIVRIDFKNGDVKHYFRHLAKAIAL